MVFSSKCEGKHMYRGVQFAIGTSTVTTETTEHYGDFNLFHLQCRGRSRNFFRRGCTRLLLNFNTSKPHSVFFFSQNTSCIRKLQVISGGVRTPCTLPLDPPLQCNRIWPVNMTGKTKGWLVNSPLCPDIVRWPVIPLSPAFILVIFKS